ncbi:hypothetical protein A9Q79_07270 [Methylophaga sp. 42_25_T18]|nr:hypothetical protein A9Q79_07270 [Methylophaga sp. 42_25_T18]OUR88604.1 hypothetical protein A9Q92_02680 [Methylophaga sp. 42_8_T64]
MEVTVSSTPLTTTTGTRVSAATVSEEETTQRSQQEQQQIQKLKARDRVVRAHESAHVAAGAGIVKGGATFSFQRGPDGVQYAVGGEVKIDTSAVSGDPKATLKKAEQIRAAALAPAQPSAADQSIAAKAAQMAVEARAEINQLQNSDEPTTNDDETSSNNTTFTPPELTGNFLDFTA